MTTSYTVYGCPVCAEQHPINQPCPTFWLRVREIAREEIRAELIVRMNAEDARDSALEEAAAVVDASICTNQAADKIRFLKSSPAAAAKPAAQENDTMQWREDEIYPPDFVVKKQRKEIDSLRATLDAARSERDTARKERDAAEKALDFFESQIERKGKSWQWTIDHGNASDQAAVLKAAGHLGVEREER